MKLIKPYFEIIKQPDLGGLSHIERCARTCYKSEDKITPGSAETMYYRLLKNKHTAMLEHGTVYLNVLPEDTYGTDIIEILMNNPYSIVRRTMYGNWGYNITTNYRVISDENLEEAFRYECLPSCHHAKRVTVKFVCDMGVAREFCRHRKFSFAQESTRYCNYSKDKFNNELTFIDPCWNADNVNFLDTLEGIEQNYLNLLKDGWKPEQARNILPLSLKTELIMTGFVDDWIHFFNLRALDKTGPAHPQAKELAIPLMENFIKQGYIIKNEDGSLHSTDTYEK